MTLIITLIIVAYVLFFFEIFVPGGVLALIGGMLLIGASWVSYGYYDNSIMAAGATLIFSFAGAVILFLIELAILPHTPAAGSLFLTSSSKGVSRKQSSPESLEGKTGEALTTMAPMGSVLIDGKKYEAISQSGMLERGNEIVVVSQDAMRVLVRRKED